MTHTFMFDDPAPFYTNVTVFLLLVATNSKGTPTLPIQTTFSLAWLTHFRFYITPQTKQTSGTSPQMNPKTKWKIGTRIYDVLCLYGSFGKRVGGTCFGSTDLRQISSGVQIIPLHLDFPMLSYQITPYSFAGPMIYYPSEKKVYYIRSLQSEREFQEPQRSSLNFNICRFTGKVSLNIAWPVSG